MNTSVMLKTEKDSLFEEIAAKIKDLQPVLRERAAHTRELRRVPEATIEALKAAGFFLALQPKSHGGYELDPQHFF